MLGHVKGQGNCRQHTRAADQVRQRQRQAVAVRDIADARTDRQDGALVVQQDVDDARHRAADAVVRRAFAGDDVVGGAPDLLVDAGTVCVRERDALNLGELIEPEPGSILTIPPIDLFRAGSL